MNTDVRKTNLIIVEFAVLQVGRRGDGAHTRVCVVVRVLTHTVWETLLEKEDRWEEEENNEGFLLRLFPFNG